MNEENPLKDSLDALQKTLHNMTDKEFEQIVKPTQSNIVDRSRIGEPTVEDYFEKVSNVFPTIKDLLYKNIVISAEVSNSHRYKLYKVDNLICLVEEDGFFRNIIETETFLIENINESIFKYLKLINYEHR